MKRLRSLRLISIVLLCWLFTPVIGVTAQKTAAPAAITIPDAYKHSLPIAGDTGIVGSETCALCHADVAKKFGNNQHAELARLHGGKGVTCESCHGPGQAHVDSGGDKTKIFDFNTAPVKVVNAKCMSCHAGTHANFDRSAHGLAGIGCTNCHSNHAATSPEHLLKVAEPALCMGCHSDVKASFAQPFHHKVNEGVLNCTTCHNPHGTFQDKMLKTAADQNMVCVKCHAETHGPFVYEHPPIKTEGCVSCHTPHGSQNPRLLIKSNVNSLCIGCHTASANFSAPGTPSFHNVANQYQSCTSCHTQIHGSNASPYFFK